jgi:inosose dehydratase
MRLAASPVSWGIDFPDHPDNPPWSQVLDEIAELNVGLLELGPRGYLPEDAALTREALAARRLAAVGSWLVLPFHRLKPRDVRELAEPVVGWIAACGGQYVIAIDEVSDARSDTAGLVDVAPRLDPSTLRRMMDGIRVVAELAVAHGARAVVHPHAGGYIEFEDEIDATLEALAPDGVGLCLDTGHSAFDGLNACALMRRYSDRLHHLHLKDLDPDVHRRVTSDRIGFWGSVHAGVFCPIGRGAVDFSAVAEVARSIGYDGAATLEQDRDPKTASRARDDVSASLAALSALSNDGA